ncbi:redoxin domain-containing protein [Arthrobacter sp. KK5.5]|uniref:redoxin domain-containing protein n=1 Tax=Arthrobacter sp. KK5.5 TaxID=3373084 RepID=UPI003EE60215
MPGPEELDRAGVRRPGVGDRAPAFSLENQFGEWVTGSRPGADAFFLVFYPFAFSRVCTAELADLETVRKDLSARGIRLFGVSVDHKHALRAYAEDLGIGFDLLSDFWPHGAAARAFGCFDEEHGRATRATFLVAGGRVAARFDSPVGRSRNLSDYRAAADALGSSLP